MIRMPGMRRLSTRLTVWYLVAFVTFISAAFAATLFTLDRRFDRAHDEELIEDFEEFRGVYLKAGFAGLVREFDLEVAEHAQQDGSLEFYRVLTANGSLVHERQSGSDIQVALDTPAPKLNDGDSPHLLPSERSVYVEDDGIETRSFRELYGFLDRSTVLHLGESSESHDDIIDMLGKAFLMILGVVVPVAGLIGWLMARAAVGGIEEVSMIAERVSGGQMDARAFPENTDLETSRLSGAFNTMLDRIHDLIVELREMTDNIAHDLKSPLARIRFMSEVALSRNLTPQELEETASQTIEECDQLIKMINISLDVAEAEAGVFGEKSTLVSFSALTDTACELFEPVAEARKITLTTSIEESCHALGSKAGFQRVIANLLDNAFKYTEPGGTVNVILKKLDGCLQLEVSDTGIGIAPLEQEMVFKRFYRVDRSRSRDGCGLGLSYVRAIVRLYRGEVTIYSNPGEGSRFVIRLPLPDASSPATPDQDTDNAIVQTSDHRIAT